MKKLFVKLLFSGICLLSSMGIGFAQVNTRINTNSIPQPNAPILSVVGPQGGSFYSYSLVCHDGTGGSSIPSNQSSIATAPTSLSGSNYVQINWNTSCAATDVLKNGSLLIAGVVGNSAKDTGQIIVPYYPVSSANSGSLTVIGPTVFVGGTNYPPIFNTLSGTVNLDTMLSNIQPITITGNTIFNLVNLANGHKLDLDVIENSPGGYSISFTVPTGFNFYWATGVSPTYSTSSGIHNYFIFTVEGNNVVGSLAGSGSGGGGGGNISQINSGNSAITISSATGPIPVITLANPVSGAFGGLGETLIGSPSDANLLQFRTSDGNIHWFSVSGDCTMSNTGVVNCTKLNGVTPGITCSANNWVNIINGSAVGSCTQPGFSNLSGAATAGQLPATVVLSVTNDTNVTGTISGQNLTLGWTGTLGVNRGGLSTSTSPSTGQIPIAQNNTSYTPETISGDTTISSSGVTTTTKTNGVAFGTLATASTPVSIANGGLNTTTAPSAAQLLVAQSSTAYAPESVSGVGDCSASLAITGVITISCSKVNGVAYSASPSTNTVPVVTSTNTTTYETVPVLAGGTGGTSASTARSNLSAAASGTNGDITSLTALTTPLSVSQGGTGTATPALVAGTNVTITGSWPDQTINSSGGGGGVSSVTGTSPIASSGGSTPAISLNTSGITAGSYTAPSVTYDAYGRATTATNNTLVTVPSGTIGQFLGYNVAGTALDAFSLTGGDVACSSSTLGDCLIDTLTGANSYTIGSNASATGSLLLANGNSSGASVTIQNPSATTAYNFNLPATAGTSGQVLTSAGGGSAAMTWGSGGGGGVSSVTASTPLASSGGSTPNITVNSAIPVTLGGLNTTTAPSANQTIVAQSGTTYAPETVGGALLLSNTSNNYSLNLLDAPPWTHFFGDASESDPNCTSTLSVQGAHYYSNLTINSGCTVTITNSNGTPGTPTDRPVGAWEAFVQGTCTIAGTINANGIITTAAQGGGSGGGGGGATAAAGANGSNSDWSGDGGVTAIVPGGPGGAITPTVGTNGGTPDASAQKFILNTIVSSISPGGSSGGLGGNTGGAIGDGGGTVILDCGSINFTGAINVSGSAGGTGASATGGGGGGGGGIVIFAARSITNTGTVTLTGGAAGTGGAGADNGGSGGTGWDKFFTLQ